MEKIGIIAEYNPFHFGHKYMINKIKKDNVALVAIMSGSFTQRGEPAIIDKWSRAKSAIESGLDLVVELPYYYSLAPAEIFAEGAIKFFNYMEIDYLYFGSESGNLVNLDILGKVSSSIQRYDREIIKKIKNGYSYSQARISLLKEKTRDILDANELEKIFTGSNNILAIEYISSIYKSNSKIKPVTIKRRGDDYSSKEITSPHPSAKAVREILLNKNIHSLNRYLPEASIASIENHLRENILFNSIYSYENIIFYLLDNLSFNELTDINFSNPDLVNRLLKTRKKSKNLKNFIESSKAKSFSKSEIKRYLFNLINNLSKDEFFYLNKQVPLIRVLAMNEIGMEVLRDLRDKNIVTKFKEYENHPQMKIEARVTNNYFLPLNKKRDLDYYKSPLIIK